MSAAISAFGPFELDAATRRLRRGGEPLPVPDRHIGILLHLVAHAGTVVSKDALVEAGWKDVAVTDNSLETGEAAWCPAVRIELWRGVTTDSERKTLRRFIHLIRPEGSRS